MLDTVNHDVEVKELFDKVTVEIPGGNGLRAINLEGFKVAIDRMMMKGFFHGGQQVLSSAEDVIERVFNKQK
jgi:hypothetical protein